MDRWALVTVLLAVTAVLTGFSFEGGNLAALLNPPAALIVFGGGLLATLAQLPASQYRPLGAMLLWLVAPPQYSLDILLSKLTTSGNALRRDGPLALEKVAASENDPVLRKALLLLADGNDVEAMQSALYLELKSREERDQDVLGVLDNLAGYLPTLGIVGAVLGLMQVLSSIKQPEALAAGIATAFVATFYGVASANLIVIPLTSTLRQRLAIRSRYYEALMLGVVALRNGVNPMALRYRMQGIVL
ncbi:motility protein A [Thalassolituus hydrocarboniclasticus]|uniref:MotA/TolQ/ExbB proton channel family protein n=1 Tax=Thalassolituus hydrocarboniclasticus TaxID=2742796 RepID=A0ABY6ABW2_9GAMM|nr:MotA/TolQ/ExbB proton channel family protein [Thalassolituus hydrocarboniclasticus]UXD88212.1 MotA/TolQ/ExbB proton channel family protein [Thalassolituus hydrocarboniclasticus]